MTRSWSRAPRLRDVLRPVVLILSVCGWAVHASGADGLAHVRSSSAVVRALMEEAAQRSPTFERLVSAINRTDGIVYVEEGVCRRSVHACLVHSVTAVAGYRFLRILIDSRGASTHDRRLDLMGTIGHELWHAMEVLRDKTLTTAAAVFFFYARAAPIADDAMETAGAVAEGMTIRGEVGRTP